MKQRHNTPTHGYARRHRLEDSDTQAIADQDSPPSPKRHRGWRVAGFVLLGLVILLAIGRAILPTQVRRYVNRTLDRNPAYSGTIGDVQMHLWRGAYSIHDIRISKTAGSVPVPFFAAKRVDFALQWDALLHHRIVGRVFAEDPEINFVDSPSEGEKQTGAGGPWLQIIRDLFPFKINSAIVKNGSVHFRAYQKEVPVDVYISQLEASLDNLSNIRDETNPLNATVDVKGLMMDQAKLEYKMTFDPFSYRPTFHMGLRLLGLDVTKLNDLALAYGKFDFKRGWFDLVVETDAKEGQIAGYIKPLFRDLKVFSLTKDIKQDNVLEFFWQALLGGVTTALKNQIRDQFGTRIPFTASATGATKIDLLATVGNLLRNAFVRAYLPKLEGPREVDGVIFGPAEFDEQLSVGGAL